MIKRDLYINQLGEYIDKPLIKVITGIRRSGKSAILKLLSNELLNRGIERKQIINLNFESFENKELNDAEKLFRYIRERESGGNRMYILLDEIQEVDSWEKAVNSIFNDFNADIYITGSNSHMLSSELATYLTGRYVELNIYTLSFEEFLKFRKALKGDGEEDVKKEFRIFLRSGGFPVLQVAEYTNETAAKVVFDIFSSILLNDVVRRNNIRDVELLGRVVRYMFDNTGNRFSAKKVADYFKSQHRKIDLNTIYNYLEALEGSYILYRIPRYDIKGKEILKTLEKYYAGDPAIINAVMGYKDRHIAGMLENIVLLELMRRGFKVYTGRSEEKEIDFIADKNDVRIYVQVSFRMESKATIDREFRPLLEIRDHYPKYVVTMDEIWRDNIEGIQHMHIADFLLKKEW
jgi:hypothetical protein